MSTIAEKAREEGDAAEQENPDAPEVEPTPEPTPEPEPVPEPAPEPADASLTEKQVEAAFKKAGKAAEQYVTKVQEALGPLFERFVPSPLDDLPGFVQVDQQGQVAPEAKAATLLFLGAEAPAEYVQNPESSMCRRCQGYGDVLSGSKRKGNELVRCVECNGYGYNPAPTVVGQVIPALPVVPANGAQVPAPQVPHGPEDPRVAELRAAGYMVLPPAQTTP